MGEDARQLGGVDASAPSGGDIEIEDVRRLAPDFVTTFKSLSRIMVAQESKLLWQRKIYETCYYFFILIS